MPGAHHFIRIGFLIFLFQERVFGELAYHVFQHFLADVLVREVFPHTVQFVLEQHVDVGFHQYLFGLEAESGTECFIVGFEKIEHIYTVIGTHDFLLQCGFRFYTGEEEIFVSPFQCIVYL